MLRLGLRRGIAAAAAAFGVLSLPAEALSQGLPTTVAPGVPSLKALMSKAPNFESSGAPEVPPAPDDRKHGSPRDFSGVWKGKRHVLSPRVYAGGNDGLAPFNAKGEAIMRNRMYASVAQEPYATAVLYCRPSGLIYDLGIGWLSQWVQNDDVVMMLIEQWQDYRTIYLNRSHPAKITPSYLGHSVGHWEGDTLVVDTIGFKGSATTWLDVMGSPHSSRLHVVERIRKLGADTLEIIATIEDPEFYTRPFQKRFVYDRRPGEKLPERNCEETMRAEISPDGRQLQ